MRFLDDMTPEEKERLEEALQRWKRAEDKVSHRVQAEYTQRFPEFANADQNLWQALQRIQTRQCQEQMAEHQDRREMVRAAQELGERGYSSLEFQDWEVSEVRSSPGDVQKAPPPAVGPYQGDMLERVRAAWASAQGGQEKP